MKTFEVHFKQDSVESWYVIVQAEDEESAKLEANTGKYSVHSWKTEDMGEQTITKIQENENISV